MDAISVSTSSALPKGVWVLIAFERMSELAYKSQIAKPIAMPT